MVVMEVVHLELQDKLIEVGVEVQEEVEEVLAVQVVLV
jgi:hypothetical protein